MSVGVRWSLRRLFLTWSLTFKHLIRGRITAASGRDGCRRCRQRYRVAPRPMLPSAVVRLHVITGYKDGTPLVPDIPMNSVYLRQCKSDMCLSVGQGQVIAFFNSYRLTHKWALAGYDGRASVKIA